MSNEILHYEPRFHDDSVIGWKVHKPGFKDYELWPAYRVHTQEELDQWRRPSTAPAHTTADVVKRSNPKDAVGTGKAPLSTVSAPVIAEVGVAMLEGARKYGRHNYRAIGVRASVYYDAAMRHLMAWWEGQNIDPDSGLHHIGKALASLMVLRDAQMNAKCVDDRPPPFIAENWVADLNAVAKGMLERYPDAPEPYTVDRPGGPDADLCEHGWLPLRCPTCKIR